MYIMYNDLSSKDLCQNCFLNMKILAINLFNDFLCHFGIMYKTV